jgi:DNA adenine methylase
VNSKTKPFLKWAGGKFRLLDAIKPLLPPGKRLIEPFVGAGAVFLNTQYSRYLLADSNPDVIGLYQILHREQQRFIRYCDKLFSEKFNCESAYYDLRAEFNTSQNTRRRAALFVYLNRHGYNGLCRYNAKGVFNVPFGSYAKPTLPALAMQVFAEKLQRVDLQVADFSETLARARPGDVIYCDPPYVPLSTTAKFTGYSQRSFTDSHQTQLAALCRQAVRAGALVLISNHDTPFTQDLYRGATIKTLQVMRNISCSIHERKPVAELLALFGPK